MWGNTCTLIIHTCNYHVSIEVTCQTCGKMFTGQCNLNTHIGATHTGNHKMQHMWGMKARVISKD